MFPVNIDRSEPVPLHDQVAAEIRRASVDEIDHHRRHSRRALWTDPRVIGNILGRTTRWQALDEVDSRMAVDALPLCVGSPRIGLTFRK
jgi:hypothetical protein